MAEQTSVVPQWIFDVIESKQQEVMHGDDHNGLDGNQRMASYAALGDLAYTLRKMSTPQCPYTFSHTRSWCNFDDCREA